MTVKFGFIQATFDNSIYPTNTVLRVQFELIKVLFANPRVLYINFVVTQILIQQETYTTPKSLFFNDCIAFEKCRAKPDVDDNTPGTQITVFYKCIYRPEK